MAEDRAGLPLAGLSALAEQTMLVPPAQPVYALGEAAWQALCEHTPGLRLDDEPMADAVCVELWCYEPRNLMLVGGLNVAPCVDPYSLALSLRDEAAVDERVSLALADLMGGLRGRSHEQATRAGDFSSFF